MSLKKQFLKSKPVCKVTFKVTKTEAEGAKELQLLGSFNNWDEATEPMKALKNGSFTSTMELPVGEAFEFRYLADKSKWINDPESEGLVLNSFGDHNSVFSTKA